MSDTVDNTGNLTPDQCAAHEFLTELRTRIATQPIPYQYGTEARALESLWGLFDQARTAIKKYPGCNEFSDVVTNMLNIDLRPVTSKWHRAYVEGRLESRDGGDEFRADLQKIQLELQSFAITLHKLAYGTEYHDKFTVSSAISDEVLDHLFKDIQFGIPAALQVSKQLAESINNDEAAEIQDRRNHYKISTKEGFNAVGLALSGGGIRSATFGLGVVQVLAERKLLNQIDFLSTVSGGGYTGSFLSRRLGDGVAEAELASPYGPDPASIRYLRQQVKFLAAKNLKESWSMGISTIGGMLLNWSAPVFCIVLLALFTVVINHFYAAEISPTLFKIFLAITGFLLLLYGWVMRWRQRYTEDIGKALSLFSALTLLTGIYWALNLGHEASNDVVEYLKLHWSFSAIGSILLLAPSLIRYLPVLKDPKIRKIVLQVLLGSAALIIPALALVLYYVFWFIGFDHVNGSQEGLWSLFSIAVSLGLIAYFVININLTGPHRLYRNGLSKTFVQTSETESTEPLLKNINEKHAAPYHLINAALNLPSSQNAALKDRRCDFFIFSKHWIGAPAIGYEKTEKWQTNGNEVDLATAMAISGAALSPHMGLGSKPTMVALLAFLNLRLGFWIKQPSRFSYFLHPGFTCLVREMLGIFMSEKQSWLNLSDGGHIENMAVYELLRRRCKFIICVDGEADPEFMFEGLMTLVRHAQIDFGVRIETNLDDLRPNTQSGLSRAHSHLCRIHYPDLNDGTGSGTGLLLYIKLSVTGNESELIKRYRLNHAEFPHQTTLDQFFDQEQFEAYRQLGVHVAEGLFSQALIGSGQTPKTIEGWFRILAGNLLIADDKPCFPVSGP